jgi:hypothetical protein
MPSDRHPDVAAVSDRLLATAVTSPTSPSSASIPPRVVLHFDPHCPFAWIASRWLLEVEQHTRIDLQFKVMSLSLLNNEPPPEPERRPADGRLWMMARACAVTERLHGQAALRRLYAALGRRIHDRGIKDVAVLPPSLADAGLPAEINDLAWTDTHDDHLRASHAAAIAPLGDAAGAPALHIDDRAVFGPVLTDIPRGAGAVKVFEAVRTLARYPGWAEMKRKRTAELSFH